MSLTHISARLWTNGETRGWGICPGSPPVRPSVCLSVRRCRNWCITRARPFDHSPPTCGQCHPYQPIDGLGRTSPKGPIFCPRVGVWDHKINQSINQSNNQSTCGQVYIVAVPAPTWFRQSVARRLSVIVVGRQVLNYWETERDRENHTHCVLTDSHPPMHFAVLASNQPSTYRPPSPTAQISARGYRPSPRLLAPRFSRPTGLVYK